MQRHNETDEVFFFLEGRCILFIGKGKETITSITAVDMVPRKTLQRQARRLAQPHIK